MHKWFIYDEFDAVSKAAAEFLAKEIEACLRNKNICHVILPGGNTPATCLRYLANKKLPWEKIHWYLGDERCFPRDHSERNDVMLDKNFWSLLNIANIHLIPAELGAEKAAEHYREEIATVDHFDIAFLGIGEDGHTASLFPENQALGDSRSVIPVYHSPKPPSDRVSLSLQTLRNAHCKVVLASGLSKASIIERIKNGESFPINCIGDINWFIDQDALSLVTI